VFHGFLSPDALRALPQHQLESGGALRAQPRDGFINSAAKLDRHELDRRLTSLSTVKILVLRRLNFLSVTRRYPR
jgi:hypothetical protein